MPRSSPVNRARVADPLILISRLLTKFYSWWLQMTYPFASVGKRLSIHYSCDLQSDVARHISIGDDVLIAKDAWLNVVAGKRADNEPAITIENGCVIARRCTISARNCIHFEPDVLFGPAALIMDHSHAYEDIALSIKDQGITEGGRIRIGQGCWIGHGAAIVCVKGELTLGRNSVVGSNSLVTRSFPPYSVISGNPARVIKQFDPVKKAWVLGSSRAAEIVPVQPIHDAAGVDQLA
jgi:acetyltransferase-like isoleucine patch superfamily enzyme